MVGACAHLSSPAGLDTLKPLAEDFHHRIRWKDFQSAALLVVPDRQQNFLTAREAADDEYNLSISDYQIEGIVLSENLKTATVKSKLYWLRLPKVIEHREQVVTTLVFQEGRWWVATMDRGPFSELAAPYSETVADKP